MRIYPILTEQDLINVGKIAEQQKNQRAIKNENLKQTHDKKMSRNLQSHNWKINKGQKNLLKNRRSVKTNK